MKNIFLGLSLLLALPMAAGASDIFGGDYSYGSYDSYDRSVSGTIRRIETERNAKCDYTRSSRMSFGFGSYQWHKSYYSCVGNNGTFRVSLKVRRELDYDATFSTPGTIDPGRRIYKEPVVTEITYN